MLTSRPLLTLDFRSDWAAMRQLPAVQPLVAVNGVQRIAHPIQLVVEVQPAQEFGELLLKDLLAHIRLFLVHAAPLAGFVDLLIDMPAQARLRFIHVGAKLLGLKHKVRVFLQRQMPVLLATH